LGVGRALAFSLTFAFPLRAVLLDFTAFERGIGLFAEAGANVGFEFSLELFGDLRFLFGDVA
jgi:hypothetical protein